MTELARISQIDTLHKVVKRKAQRLLFDANSMGLNVGIFETRRLEERQAFLQGKKASRVSVSWHMLDLAIDIWPKTDMGGWPTLGRFEAWDGWELLGEIGERHGFEWGGRWRRWHDKCHFQMTFGLNKSVAWKILNRSGREALHDFVSACVENDTNFKSFLSGGPYVGS